jgi:hypothetical protein
MKKDNSGDRNSGDHNSGNCNSGDRNSGNRNSGDRNSGDRNSGDHNSGYRNSGYCNSGNCNSGNCNSGDRNSGDLNSGDYNSGNCNSGDCNSGDRNSGDYNSGNYNSGLFNTDSPTLRLFNKQSDLTYESPLVKDILRITCLSLNDWIPSDRMSDQEKESNPGHETVGGYLRSYTYHEAWQNLWATLSFEQRSLYAKLPNFDSAIFKEITSIDMDQHLLEAAISEDD